MKCFGQSSFSVFFRKFPNLFIAGLLFSVALSAFTGIFLLICYLTGFNNVIIWGLGIIPAAPIYSGLVMVIRKYSIEKDFAKIIPMFFSAVKENLKKSIINGLVAYLIVACSFFAILYYGSLAQTDIVYGAVLTLYLIFSLILIVMLFYVPLLTITYELRLRDIYKNAFLLVFGKILRNLIAAIIIAVITIASVIGIVFTEGAVRIAVIILIAMLYPLAATYVINSIIAKGVQDSVGYFTGNNVHYSNDEDNSVYDNIELQNTTDDFIFVNGRFVKNPNKHE